MPLFGKSSSSGHPPPPAPAQSPYPPAHQLHQSNPPPPHSQQQQQYGGQSQQYYQQGHQPQQSQQYPPPGSQHQQQSYGGGGGAGGEPPLRDWFNAVDVDRSGYITLIELKQALVNGDWQPFDDQTVQMLMRIFDTDGNGTVSFQEFTGLWQYIKEWQGVFRTFDRDHSGTIEPHELQNALATFGYSLSPQLINLVQRKYNPSAAVKPAHVGGFAGPRSTPGITFDRFVRCCVTVRQLSESFKQVDQDRDGWVNLSYEQFMSIVLSAP